jgi:hypothetical protein
LQAALSAADIHCRCCLCRASPGLSPTRRFTTTYCQQHQQEMSTSTGIGQHSPDTNGNQRQLRDAGQWGLAPTSSKASSVRLCHSSRPADTTGAWQLPASDHVWHVIVNSSNNQK